jgi:hypothetical protein
MVEYHIDSSYEFEEQLQLLTFGGNLLVQKPVASNTAFFVGQDEVYVNSSYFFQRCGWAPAVNVHCSQRMRELVPSYQHLYVESMGFSAISVSRYLPK